MATNDAIGNAFGRLMNQNNTHSIGLGRVNRQAQNDRPKSQFWINLGYPVDYQLDDGSTEQRFVSLPIGIPLDGQERLPTNSKNEQFAAFQVARNELLDQLMAIAQTLEPGEDKIINLKVQIRRVNEEVIRTEDNPFIKKLNLLGTE